MLRARWLPPLRPGALQLRGENLVALLDGLAASKELRTRKQRRQMQQRQKEELAAVTVALSNSIRSNNSSREKERGDAWTGGSWFAGGARDEMPVYFNFLGLGMVRRCLWCSSDVRMCVSFLSSMWF